MFNQQNLNTAFQQISIPNVTEKGPRLSQAQTFLNQKDLITEQSLDRLTVKCSQSQLNYETPSPQQQSQQNTYKSQEGLARSNDDMLNVISSDPAASSNNFKQSLAILKNPNLNNPQALYLGSDCFIENIQRSYPYQGPQSLESSSAVVHLPNTVAITNVNQKYIVPFNGTQLPNSGQQVSNNKPNFQLNLNQVTFQQQLVGNQCNYKHFQQNDVNFNAPKENYSMVQQFGIPPLVNYNSNQLQQYQATKQPMTCQNLYDVSKQIPNQNSYQSSPIKFLVTPIQQQITLQSQTFNSDIYKNNRQYSPNFLHTQPVNGCQNNFIQTNFVATPSKDGNSQYINYENIQNSRNVSPDNQINNIHALNSKLQPNVSLISALNNNTLENTNSSNKQIQSQNQIAQNINKFQVYNVQNVQKKLNLKTQNQQQQLTPYTITFGSSNNLNTVQSNNNNSSTMYQLLQPYQITNQSNNSQLNELSNASKGSQQIESQNYRSNETNKPHHNQFPSNTEFNCMISTKNQLSQFPQLLPPYVQNKQQINNAYTNQGAIDTYPTSQNNHSKESYQQNIKNVLKPQNEQQQYQFYPISIQRKGSQSQYMSPKESNSTALTSPIDIQVRQNKLSSCLQGESNHTTMRICEMSSTMNPLQIPSENISQREENIQNQNAQNVSYQTSDKYILQNNNNRSDLNQKQSDQSSSVTIYQASSQTGQSSNQFVYSNNSLNSQKSGKCQQLSGLVQINEEIDSDNQIKKIFLNQKQESNQPSNSNHQIYYYKTNKQESNEETKKKCRKSNQSYDLAASYYNRIRQFNESSHEEKIELCLKGSHKQCLINPRRVSLNKTDKSLDGSNIQESNYNSSKCNSNSQLTNSTQLNNSSNVKNLLSKSKERNSSQEKQKLGRKPPKIKDSQQLSDNLQQQPVDNHNSLKVNEEKLLSLLSPSYKRVQQIQQLMKIEHEKLQKEKEKFTEIQESKGIFTFSNQRKHQNKQTKVSPNNQGNNNSPNSQLSSDTNSPINKKNSSKKQELEQNFSETKSADKYQREQCDLNQESEQTEEKCKKTSFGQQFKSKPIVQAAFQVNPYFVADKYFSAQEIQDYQQHIQNYHTDVQNYEQIKQKYQQSSQIDLQNYSQQKQDYHQERQIYHKNNQKELQSYNYDKVNDEDQQNYFQQLSQQQQNDGKLNNSQNQQLQNFSLAPDHFNNNHENQNTFQQINDQNLAIRESDNEQTISKQIFNQIQKQEGGLAILQQTCNHNKNYLNQQLNQSKKGKLINTIYIDMSEVSDNGSKIPVFKGCSLTTTNSSYQNKGNQFQLYNSNDDTDQFNGTNKFQKEHQQKKQIFIDQNQKENNFQNQNNYQAPSNNLNNKINIEQNINNINYSQNQFYLSPDKRDTNQNQIVIFDTQFQTQEDLKSTQNLNYKNWSTLQGMNMVTVESQNGGYDNIQKFQFSPQTLQTEQGMYNFENSCNNNNNQQIAEKKEENNNNCFDNAISLEKSHSKSNQRYSCNQNLDEESPNNSYYYLQDSPQIKSKQIRPTIVPQLNLQKSFQNTLTTLNQNTSFNISLSPSSHKNIQQNFKSQLSNLNYKQSNLNQTNYKNQENDENINYIQQPDYQKTCSNKQSFKRHVSLSNLNQFHNNNIQPFQGSKQSTLVNNKIYLPTQPNSLTNSAFLNATANEKETIKNQASNSNIKTIQRNKSLGSIVGNVGYQSEEMGHEMFLTKKLKNQLNNHLQFLENRIKLLQREEEQIRKKASSSKKQAENVKKIYQEIQEEHQNHHTAIETQQKNWIEAKKSYIQNAKKEHSNKIKKVMIQQQREKQEMARSIKFNSHINKSVAEDLKQSHLIKTSEKKNQIKQSQLKCQEQRHLQQLYNQTSQMQQFLLKIKEEKVKKEELEQKIQALEQLEMQLVEKLQQTYESNKHYLKNSNMQSQLSVHQSNIIDHQQQAKRESLQSNTEVINTNTSFTVFNQY
ncbi:hypothetical protein ABPG72_006238 [Tetrahymena utriculariae]